MGLGALSTAIDDASIDACAADLIGGFVLLDRLAARLIDAVGGFDRSGLWALDGAGSMTAWLKAAAGRTGSDAASVTKIARMLHALPVTSAAFAEGRLSYGHVQTITANVTPATLSLFAEHEPELVPTFEVLTIRQLQEAMQHWARHARVAADEKDPVDPVNTVHHSGLLNGTSQLDAALDAEATEVVARALEIAETPWQEGEPIRPAAERRADAFVDVFQFFLDNHTRSTGTRNTPHLTIIMTPNDIANHTGATTLNGTHLPHHRVRKLCCDATINRVVANGSEVIDYGRHERLAPLKLFLALALADKTCRYPGCDRKPSWCHAHHVHHWEDGGPTDFDNLVLLCSRHHHHVHKPGWHLTMQPDRTVIVSTPGGTLTSDPPHTRQQAIERTVQREPMPV
jgi:hypothetical protein